MFLSTDILKTRTRNYEKESIRDLGYENCQNKENKAKGRIGPMELICEPEKKKKNKTKTKTRNSPIIQQREIKR